MYLIKVAVLSALVLGTFAEESVSTTTTAKPEPSYCGQEEPDSEKLCISIRLPWQDEPVFFCTNKGRISYKDRCGHDIHRWCYGQDRDHTLQIATPWDCCPITSIPDYCSGRTCPTAPFNRTCEEIQPDKKDPWDCCSKFYCDQDIKSEDCHMNRLRPGCMKAPKNKTNCVGFKDEYGCCNKYQCEGEGKAGMCPMEAAALKYKQLMLESKSKSANNESTSMMSKFSLQSRRYLFSRFYSSSTTYSSCTGDHTCPGSMKCCSGSIESYHGVRKYMTNSWGSYSSERAVYGYCMEPVEEAKLDELTDESSTGNPTSTAEGGSSTAEGSSTVAAG